MNACSTSARKIDSYLDLSVIIGADLRQSKSPAAAGL
jgi:hypothetical protein